MEGRTGALGHRFLGFRWALGFGLWVLTAVAAAGCAKAQAKAVPDGPPLQMPAPPPRVIATLEEPPPAPFVEEPPAAAPAPPKPAPLARPAPKPDVKAEAPVEVAPRETKPAEPRALRAPGRDDAKERAIRDQLTGASRTLGRVDYARLSRDGRSQYEQSRRFIEQAEQALKEQNLVFAATLADKAATLAGELVR